DLFEVPVSTVSILHLKFPMAGGAYFRIIPYWIFRTLVAKKLKQDGFYNFYLHPWEFEPEQERIKNLNLNYKLRHYYNLNQTHSRLNRLIRYLKSVNTRFLTLSEYVLQSSGKST
ncbi:MAG: DUF3473 domain-containing protein, partial [Calditrichia bacterium]